MAGSSWRWYIFIVQVLKQQQQKKKMEKKDQKKKKEKKKANPNKKVYLMTASIYRHEESVTTITPLQISSVELPSPSIQT